MSALLPHSALRLLSILEREGLLSVRSMAEPAPWVPAIFRRPRHSSAAREKVTFPKCPCQGLPCKLGCSVNVSICKCSGNLRSSSNVLHAMRHELHIFRNKHKLGFVNQMACVHAK